MVVIEGGVITEEKLDEIGAELERLFWQSLGHFVHVKFQVLSLKFLIFQMCEFEHSVNVKGMPA